MRYFIMQVRDRDGGARTSPRLTWKSVQSRKKKVKVLKLAEMVENFVYFRTL